KASSYETHHCLNGGMTSMRSMAQRWFVASLTLMFAGNALASARDPLFLRDLERQTKSEQARALHRRLVLNDFAAREQLAVDAYHFDLQIFPAEARLTGVVTLDLAALADMKELTLDA